VLALGGNVVARGKLVDEFHVGGKSGTGEDALEEIVAEETFS